MWDFSANNCLQQAVWKFQEIKANTLSSISNACISRQNIILNIILCSQGLPRLVKKPWIIFLTYFKLQGLWLIPIWDFPSYLLLLGIFLCRIKRWFARNHTLAKLEIFYLPVCFQKKIIYMCLKQIYRKKNNMKNRIIKKRI